MTRTDPNNELFTIPDKPMPPRLHTPAYQAWLDNIRRVRKQPKAERESQ